MATPVALLYGDGVPQETLARVAARHGMKIAAPDAKPASGGANHVLLLASLTHDSLIPWLSRPFSAYVEIIDGEDDPLNDDLLEGLAAGKLCFSLATSTSYLIDSAALVCEALAARGVLTPIRRSDVELSLHETISNAVVHGNLALESNMKGDISHFAQFAMELQKRMHAPEARLRIDISAGWDSEFLDVSIADKGKGYDESKLPVNLDPFAPAGRGLAIIRSLTLATNVTHGGRVTTLRFVT